MITNLDQATKDRVNKAIGNIRLIATRAKRANILDATQKAEIVVNLLNEFRQYINVAQYRPEWMGNKTSFRHDRDTLARIVQATMQADNVYNMLARANKKKYQEEYQQVWHVLENIHDYLARALGKGAGNG